MKREDPGSRIQQGDPGTKPSSSLPRARGQYLLVSIQRGKTEQSGWKGVEDIALESKHTDLLRITLTGGFGELTEIMRGKLTPLLPNPAVMTSGPLSTLGVSFGLPKTTCKETSCSKNCLLDLESPSPGTQ